MNDNLRKWNKLFGFLYSFTMLTSWQLGVCTTSAPITTAFAPNSARKSKLNLQVWATSRHSFHEVSLFLHSQLFKHEDKDEHDSAHHQHHLMIQRLKLCVTLSIIHKFLSVKKGQNH